MAQNIVDSRIYSLKELFADKFEVDFYQREYVWQKKQLEDLISDLVGEFLKNYKDGDTTKVVEQYNPYFMGEIIVSQSNNKNFIIDGQQRITTFTLLLIWIVKRFDLLQDFPKSDIEQIIYKNHYGTLEFNLDIEQRKECMLSLFKNGDYAPSDKDRRYTQNIVDRYNDITECFDDRINKNNIINFAYWLTEKIMFSKVWTNSDEFAYVIFETMNDRGLSLTQVEMLRSYLLANIDEQNRDDSTKKFDEMVVCLKGIKLSSNSKAEFEFFKIYFRGHYAKDFSQGNLCSDFVRIGKEFHRWVRDNSKVLGLEKSSDYIEFISKIDYFAKQYEKINSLIASRDTQKYLYLIVNNDYTFTLQPALILSAITFNDSDKIVEQKIKIVSKYLSSVLTSRVWNLKMISQSSMEAPIYALCKEIRNMQVNELQTFLDSNPYSLIIKLESSPTLNQQNKSKIKVLLALITEIVAKHSKNPDYVLNKPNIEVEHILANHFEQHNDEFKNEIEFSNARNNIGDLLLLPKGFNASYNDKPYNIKVEQYFEQNILAQTLNSKKYTNNPDFNRFVKESELPFRPYEQFKRNAIFERAELYKQILQWNFSSLNQN